MHVECTNSDPLVVNQLPDGSRIIVHSASEKVFALIAAAGVAWDACSVPETLARVTENMRRSFDPKTTEELAEEAILQLQDKQLVKTWGASSQSSRRKFLTTLGAAAVPLVVSLTIADQKAYVGATGSKPTTHPPTVPLPTPHSSTLLEGMQRKGKYPLCILE